jgi:biopolymer transport protein ExbB
MFLSADVLVKAVMIALALASLMAWTIAVSKTIEMWLARRRLQASLDRISGSKSLVEAQIALGSSSGLTGDMLAIAVREMRMSEGTFGDSGIKERARSSFAELSRAEGRRVRFGMGALATIGAISPFVGLFGTVWGIMNSFIGISKSQTTNLAVVAPGIAEALLATAIGLVAAIPAVIIYNHFFSRHQEPHGTGRPGDGRSEPPAVARSRSQLWQFASSRGGVNHGCCDF